LAEFVFFHREEEEQPVKMTPFSPEFDGNVVHF